MLPDLGTVAAREMFSAVVTPHRPRFAHGVLGQNLEIVEPVRLTHKARKISGWHNPKKYHMFNHWMKTKQGQWKPNMRDTVLASSVLPMATSAHSSSTFCSLTSIGSCLTSCLISCLISCLTLTPSASDMSSSWIWILALPARWWSTSCSILRFKVFNCDLLFNLSMSWPTRSCNLATLLVRISWSIPALFSTVRQLSQLFGIWPCASMPVNV